MANLLKSKKKLMAETLKVYLDRIKHLLRREEV